MKFSTSYFLMASIAFVFSFAQAEGSTGSPSAPDKIKGYSNLYREVVDLRRDHKSLALQLHQSSKLAADLSDDLDKARGETQRLILRLSQSSAESLRLTHQLQLSSVEERKLREEIVLHKRSLQENQSSTDALTRSLEENRLLLEDRNEASNQLGKKIEGLTLNLEKESRERAEHQEKVAFQERTLKDLGQENKLLQKVILEKEALIQDQTVKTAQILEEKKSPMKRWPKLKDF